MDHMEHTQVADELRNARRQAQSRRQVAKGEVLYASEGSQMVKSRADAEVDKAQVQLRKAQNARERALQAERKLLFDKIKSKAKEVNARLIAISKPQAKAEAMVRATLQAYKKKFSSVIFKAMK